MKLLVVLFRSLVLVTLLVLAASIISAQTSTFTYQGRLTDGGTPPTGTYDMQFKLYDTATVGTGALQGSPNTVTNATVNVASGVFTVQLDFGASGFPGTDRYLEINVRHPGDPAYTTLSPRQQLTSTPYAIRSLSAASADNATTATTATNNVLKGGDTMTGQLVLSGDPAVALGAATKQYVDSTAATKLNLSGGTMSGVLNMAGNKVTSLATPTNGTDAANKSYVDAAVTPASNFFFGDGSDGDTTITVPTTLTRDMYYHNLTINPGGSLDPGGYRIFVSGTLTLGNGTRIARDGNGGSAGGPGAALTPGTLGGSGAGGTLGSAGGVVTNSLGGSGGGGGGGGGIGGSATGPVASAGGGGVFRSALQTLSGRSLDGVIVNGGGGGGSGGGGGGGGGGVVVIAARTVALSGGAATIMAQGGDGGPSASFGGGGGGGGGGGVVVVITTTPQLVGLTLSAIGGGSPDGGNGVAGFTAWLN